jgi:hypothetical protein
MKTDNKNKSCKQDKGKKEDWKSKQEIALEPLQKRLEETRYKNRTTLFIIPHRIKDLCKE